MAELNPSDASTLEHELERWWRDHGDLDYRVGGVVHTLTHRGAAAASAALEELAEGMDAHFAAEEEVYFPLVERLVPEHAPDVQRARLAHQGLRDQIDDLRTLLTRGEVDPARGVLSTFLERLRTHEELEGRFIAQLAELQRRDDSRRS